MTENVSGKKAFCANCGSIQERYMSVETAAAMFDLTKNAVRGLIRRREIHFVKLGSRVRILYTEMASQLKHYPSKFEFEGLLAKSSSRS